MKKYVNIYIFVIVILAIIIVVGCISYNFGISPVSKESQEVIFEVKENSTYLSIAPILKENNLIRSETFYKIYVKIFNPSNLEKGTYTLNRNMGVKEIINTLEQGTEAETISFVIPEGRHITDVATYISEVTDYSSEELLNYWQSEELLDTLINKYWFITDEVKNDNLRYNLEGYFFPATYEIFKDSSMEEITYKMLDKMDEVLSKYKTEIENSDYTVHELLTLASIVENEAILDEDRPMIAQVFYNRLNQGMKLQSCATIGYAIDEWKLTYTNADLAVDSPYNTYVYYGLPVGPGNSPGEASIKAVLYPEPNNYLYFLANVYDSSSTKTYYSETYPEHQQKCLLYLGYAC